MLLMFVVILSACSTRPYTSGKAVRDLEEQSQLTHTQAKCVVTSIRKHFEVRIKARQKALKGSPLPADRLRLEVDSALATIRKPKGPEEEAARLAIARCAPNALR